MPDPTGSGGKDLSFGAWAQLLNFKADQRRVLIGDDGQGALVGLVGSADPHEASSQHSNAALRLGGAAIDPLLQSELAIARLSGWHGSLPQLTPAAGSQANKGAVERLRVQVLTEGAIGAALLSRVKHATPDDTIDIATLYLADQELIVALLEAAHRGVTVRLILDPGKDGFGEVRTGLPNQPAASALVSQGDGNIHVRWYRTHGEQFHTRVAMIHSERHQWLLVGSADLTRHALADYHLEADVAVDMPASEQLAEQTRDYFDTLWNNRATPGTEYTADFALYADPAPSHYWLYRFMEGTGWAPF
jgi:phosphatidylserine/phosphatidylglycerophosphate/cardiolipin synthase-like enzyme